MQTDLITFESPEFGQVRTIERNGEPWFVAADVCRALEIGNPTDAMRRLDADERTLVSIEGASNGLPVNAVNEPGLYTLILGSRKPEAKAFKRWITHEVIPSIRKTGGYIFGQETMSDSELMAKALLVAQRQIEERNRQIETMQPKALFADAVSASSTSILVGELAKLLKQNGVDMGQKRLFQWLRDNGYLIRQQGISRNMPTQRSMEMGLFEIKESTHLDSNGNNIICKTPKVTGKGQVYFTNKFLCC